MSGLAWLSLVACAGHLALAGLALGRVGKSPLALPLSLLSIARESSGVWVTRNNCIPRLNSR
jgi:hypothetical protein